MNLHQGTSQHRYLASQNTFFQLTPAFRQSRLAPTPSYFHHVADTGVDSVINTLLQLNLQNAGKALSGDNAKENKGWILVLGPTHVLTKQLLEKYQIDAQRVLLINQKQIHRYDNLMRDALTCSTCEAVLSFLPQHHQALADYQYLANKYKTSLYNHSSQTGIAYVM